jgi:hypothetical protein
MRGCPARHVPCGAHHGHGLRGEGSPHEPQRHAGALRLPRAHVRRWDADGELAEAAGQGREG